MTVVVFRNRMAPDAPDGYEARAQEMFGLASQMPGFRSVKQFVAEDGEQLALVEFESEAHSRAWRDHPEHRKAQQEGREVYYAEYRLQVCEVVREARFER